MAEKTIGKLMKASEISAKEQLQHLVIMLSYDGQFVVTGSNNFITTVTDAEELTRLKEILFQNKQHEGPVSPAQILEYPLLPCSPYSAAWNKGGADLARSVLTRMLDRIGYGGGGRTKKLGVGDPPFGWPGIHPWVKFIGVTRSGLSFNDVTGIIISMLVASNVDPNTHVKKEEIMPVVIHEQIIEEQPAVIQEQNTEDQAAIIPEQNIEDQQALILNENIGEQQENITEEITSTMPSTIHVEQNNGNLQAGLQEEQYLEKQQVIQEHFYMAHETDVELEVEVEVQTENTEQMLGNNVVNPGDDKVKRRKFGS